MIVISEDRNRKHEEGQIRIDLITFEPTLNMPISGKFGYWCDLSHVKAGILRPLIAEFTEEVREILKEYDNKSTYQITVEYNGDYFEISGRDTLYAQLILQEVKFWYRFPEEFHLKNFDFIVDRRGFNKKEAENLKNFCLFMGLKNIWNIDSDE